MVTACMLCTTTCMWHCALHPCKLPQTAPAALLSFLGRYAHTVERLLEVAPLRRFMVQLPPAVESWREQLRLKGGLFRTIRWVPGWSMQ